MNEKAAIAVLAALEGAHAYSAFLPSVFTIRTFAQGNNRAQNVKNIRLGYIPATALAIGVGWIAGHISKSSMPVLAALFVSVMMVGVYEWAIRMP